MCELHAHVTEATESDYANFLAFGDTPMVHGRVRCDAGAKQRSGPGEVEVRGNAQDKSLVDDDAVGVAAVGDPTQMLVGEVISKGEVWAELFEASLALGAGAV